MILGMLEPQEINKLELAGYDDLDSRDQINHIAEMIATTQRLTGLAQRTIDIDEVVKLDVEKFFRVTMQYDTFPNTIDVPAGMTRITKISW